MTTAPALDKYRELIDEVIEDTQCAHRIVRTGESFSILGCKTTAGYAQVKDELLTPPIKIMSRSSGWPLYELIAINRLRIAGASDDENRALVRALVALRKTRIIPADLQVSA